METRLFRVPYILDEKLLSEGRVERVCAIDKFTPEIQSINGDWTETQFNNHEAVVLVRGNNKLLNQLGKLYKSLSETEARKLCVEDRLSYKWNFSKHKFDLVPNKVLKNRQLEHVHKSLPKNPLSKELLSLIGIWSAVGFGQGWRLPYHEVIRGAMSGLPPLWGNAFPISSVLDNFNRANEGPPPSSNWTNWKGSGSKVASNQWNPSGSGGDNGSYWNVQDFGPNCEVYVTGTTPGAYTDLYSRLVDFGNGGDGYDAAMSDSSNTIRYFRVDNGAYTAIGATISQAIANGDAIGLEIIGSTLQAYYKASGGSWVAQSSRSDSTYSGAGKLAITGQGSTVFADDFGGGTIAQQFDQSVAGTLTSSGISINAKLLADYFTVKMG
jgi:hypothetical protein